MRDELVVEDRAIRQAEKLEKTEPKWRQRARAAQVAQHVLLMEVEWYDRR